VRLDEKVRTELAELTDLAPLHQPRALAGVAAAREVLSGVPAGARPDQAGRRTRRCR